ncbi:MAG: pimeloyl-CoA dehydrogenase large subunit, partial [Proteobacteria bacterium]|nr:pimeloyl-CoA dehydrogenase large subunit [Pseudomonadota bacterium]
DDVRVPANNLIGEENKGWTYAKMLLTHERTNIAGVPRGKRRLRALKQIAMDTDDGHGNTMMDDAVFKNKLAALEIELLALEYSELRTLAALSVGKAPGPESSILKIVGTELAQEMDELFVELAAYHCLPFVPEQFEEGFQGEPLGPGTAAASALTYFNNRKLSIFGGSNEIQRNIISKAVLGL